MSTDSPKKPSRPARPSQPERPAKRPTPAQQSLKDKAESSASSEADEDEEFEEEPGVMAEWLRQSPSWLTSMVVHMILLLVLALWALPEEMKDNFKEIVLGDPDILEEEALEEEPDAPLEEDPEKDIDADEPQDEVAPEDFEVESPEVQIPTENDDLTLAAAKVDFVDFATESAVQGTLLTDLGGLASSGLGNRSAAGRAGAVRRGGGDGGTESAVEAALRWLKDHQNRNGSWSWNHTPGDRCSGYANPGDKKSKMGATGLALLPFLGAGYTHQDGKYKETVHKGLKYLVGNMQVANNTGRLFEADGAGHEHMYCHGIAACALAEAYGMSQDPKLKAPSQLAINYIIQAQHPETGGWLYTPRQAPGDTSVVGWQVMALKSAVLSYLTVPPNVKKLSNKWLDFVQSDLPPGGYGIGSRYGYRKAGDRHNGSGATTAIGLLCRNYLGTKKEDPGLQMGVEWLGKKGPASGDMYYNYYASMVMFQNNGPNGKLWKSWNQKMKKQLVDSQVKNGKDRGSWYFAGGHGSAGGRVYNTAMAAMTLEVYYRYLPIYQKENVEQDDFPLE